MNRRIIQNSLPIVARAIGRQCDVQVVVGGDKAMRVGSVIHLPTLPFEDPDVETLAYGFLEHEAAHVRYTETSDVDSALHHALWNCIEDVRIERKLGEEYPGFASTLRALVAKLVDTGHLARVTEEDKPANKLLGYLLYRLRHDRLQQSALQEHAEEAERLFRKAFPAGAAVRVGSVIGRVRDAQSSADACELAREIVAILEEEKEALENPQPPQDGASTDSADTPSVSADDTQKEAQSTTIDVLAETLAMESDDLPPGVGQLASEALTDASEKANSSGAGAGVGRATEALRETSDDVSALLAEAKEATVALRSRLRSVVEATRRTKRSSGRLGTRLDERRLVRAMLGDSNIYRRKCHRQEVDAAVHILGDRSLSMAGHPMEVARKCLLALAACLEGMRGVDAAASVFPGVDTDVEILMRHHESVRRTAGRFGAITANGGTPLLEALMWVVDTILTQPEKRKVILVVTDDEPLAPVACREAISRCWLGGIEVYGVGVGVSNSSSVFPVMRSIGDIAELPDALFEMLQDAVRTSIA